MFFKSAKSPKKPELIGWDGLLKQAQTNTNLLPNKIAERMKLDPQSNFYLQNWAVSALEKWGWNDNFDAFEREELRRSYPTFVGSWACLDHQNHHVALAVGENIDSVYMPDDYVQICMAINKNKAESRHPGLEDKIARGVITDTSMGCLARESVCSICGNVAFDENQYCDDILRKRGQKICDSRTNWKETVAFEKNRGVVFFEDSIITDAEGADRQAKIIAKLAAHALTGPRSIPADKLYRVLKEQLKTAGTQEAAFLAMLTDRITQVLEE
jgi:hypothetical protein